MSRNYAFAIYIQFQFECAITNNNTNGGNTILGEIRIKWLLFHLLLPLLDHFGGIVIVQ